MILREAPRKGRSEEERGHREGQEALAQLLTLMLAPQNHLPVLSSSPFSYQPKWCSWAVLGQSHRFNNLDKNINRLMATLNINWYYVMPCNIRIMKPHSMITLLRHAASLLIVVSMQGSKWSYTIHANNGYKPIYKSRNGYSSTRLYTSKLSRQLPCSVHAFSSA